MEGLGAVPSAPDLAAIGASMRRQRRYGSADHERLLHPHPGIQRELRMR